MGNTSVGRIHDIVHYFTYEMVREGAVGHYPTTVGRALEGVVGSVRARGPAENF